MPKLRNTYGDPALDKELDLIHKNAAGLKASVAKLQSAPAPTTTTTVVQVPAGALPSLEVKTADGAYDTQVSGVELDQAAGFSLTNDGTLAKVSLPSLSTGAGTFTGAFAHKGTTVGFYNVTPASRPSAYTLTYSTSSRTNSNPTAAAVGTTGSTQTTPFGYTTAAQADAIPVAINALEADVLNMKQVLTQVIKDLQAVGLLQ